MKSSNSRGFSLMELMVAVAIVGILATIAIPSYNNHVRKARRSDATAMLMDSAQQLERFFTENGRYDKNRTGANFQLQYTASPRDGSTKYYGIEARNITTTSFLLRAEPVGVQTKDDCGVLTLTSTGQKGAQYQGVASTDSDYISKCWIQ